jgi:hypothetical protein
MVVSSPTIFRVWGENMAKDITLAELQTMADRSGLQLTDEDLEKLLPGVNRSLQSDTRTPRPHHG